MGTDRKGPLAAFVVIAIIAAILLVTSVRSQAAPGWLDPDNLPASVVAAPPLPGPREWVTTEVDRVVEKGVVLLRRASSDPVRTQDPTTAPSASATGTSGGGAPADATALIHPATHAATHSGTHSATHQVTAKHHAVRSGATTTTTSATSATTATSARHGRHLGWYHAHIPGHAHHQGRHLGWSSRH